MPNNQPERVSIDTPINPNLISNVFYKALDSHFEELGKREYSGMSEKGYCNLKLFKKHSRNDKLELDRKTQAKFLRGHLMEKGELTLLWKFGRKYDEFSFYKSQNELEIKTPGGNIIKGHSDLKAKWDGHTCHTDIKNVDYINKIKQPHQHYIDQLMLYNYADGYDYCVMIYFSSSDMQVKPFVFPVDIERVKYLLNKHDKLIEAIKTNTPPEKPFKSADESWECNYCPYKKECWKNTGYNKSKDEVDISDIADDYAELYKKQQEIKAKLDEYRTEIEKRCEGKKGISEIVTATYIEPSQYVSYDKKKLIKNVNADTLKQCEKITNKKGYYKIKVEEAA